MGVVGNKSSAVMQQRNAIPDGLDLFPTPPWALRGFMHYIEPTIAGSKVWEPAAGKGHLSHVLRGSGCDVFSSDIFNHPQLGPKLDAIGDFQCDMSPPVPVFSDGTDEADWIVTNPPFNAATRFAEKAIERCDNVALLCRVAFMEGKGRFNELFTQYPCAKVAVHAERVPMCADVWDPDVASATCYAWFVWKKGSNITELVHVPPGCRNKFTQIDDLAFAEKRVIEPDDGSDTLFEVTK